MGDAGERYMEKFGSAPIAELRRMLTCASILPSRSSRMVGLDLEYSHLPRISMIFAGETDALAACITLAWMPSTNNHRRNLTRSCGCVLKDV